MSYAIETIQKWFEIYYADGFYLTLAIFAFIYLFVHFPELRAKFLIPMGLVVVVVLNPVMYQLILRKVVYWRLFWMFPTAILIGLAVIKMIQYCDNNIMKVGITLLFCGLVLLKGTNTFQHGGFTIVQTLEKLPKEVQAVCNELLAKEEEPRCIMPQTLFCDVRQYSGDINMMYGRNAHGYIAYMPDMENRVYEQMESETPDYEFVLQKASEGDYTYVVTYENRPIAKKILNTYGYEEMCLCEGYIIYQKVTDVILLVPES
ncbi:MAG: hypothetical protein ACI4EH_06705 [Oliverpabstia sp.]